MFAKGDLIVYGNTGVCRVDEVGRRDHVPKEYRDKLYYTLSPFYSEGVIYAPVDTPVFMRHVLSRAAADELILKIPRIQGEACYSRDQKFLSDHYQAAFETHR